ncbi:Hypothetical_protein [Hexamita inflata]|uniref:Hypothetical_protein n=1 Tax=Hexamita inflata TaxID=28002 RepID=A0AA86V304_9EUKA|nr:Hypothetical protein HINF_LOCUS61861 [Hexamita inflata]
MELTELLQALCLELAYEVVIYPQKMKPSNFFEYQLPIRSYQLPDKVGMCLKNGQMKDIDYQHRVMFIDESTKKYIGNVKHKVLNIQGEPINPKNFSKRLQHVKFLSYQVET